MWKKIKIFLFRLERRQEIEKKVSSAKQTFAAFDLLKAEIETMQAKSMGTPDEAK